LKAILDNTYSYLYYPISSMERIIIEKVITSVVGGMREYSRWCKGNTTGSGFFTHN